MIIGYRIKEDGRLIAEVKELERGEQCSMSLAMVKQISGGVESDETIGPDCLPEEQTQVQI